MRPVVRTFGGFRAPFLVALAASAVVFPLVSATPANATTYFSNGFETGLSPWSVGRGGAGAVVVQSSIVRSGRYAAHLTSSATAGSYAYVRRSVFPGYTSYGLSVDVYVGSEGPANYNTPIIRAFGSNGAYLFGVYRQNRASDHVWIEYGGTYHLTTGTLPLGQWAHVDVLVTGQRTSSWLRVLENGTQVYAASVSLPKAFATLQLGNERVAEYLDAYVDNAAITDGVTTAPPPTPSASIRPAPTATPAPTPAPSVQPAPTATSAPSPTPSPAATPTPQPTASPSPMPSPAATPTPQPTASPSASGTPVPGAFYVSPTGNDANAGTATAPWRTLQKAANTVPAGATVYFRAGTYAGGTISRSGVAGSPTVYASYPGETAVIAGDSSHTKVVDVSGAANIAIRGLTVQGAPAQWGAGIYVENGATAVTIEGNLLRQNHSFGIKLQNVSGITVRNNDITLNDTGIELDYAGEGTLLTGNRIYQNDTMVVNTPCSVNCNDDRGANGFVFYKTTGHVTVSNNQLWGNRATSYDYGQDGGAFEIYAASNLTITGNRSWDNENVLETGTDGGACSGNVFTRNVAYGGKGVAYVAGPAEGVILRCAGGMLVANNTFSDLDGFVFDVTATGSFSGAIDGLRITNNIAVMAHDKIYSIDSALPTSVVIDRNLAWQSGSGYVAYVAGRGNTASFATFQSWGFEPTGITGDPRFVDRYGGDFHLQSTSPAIDRGVLLAGVTDGYLGLAPDLGAYEYGG